MFDILLVKSLVIPVLRRMADAGMNVCSVHPMFVPTAPAVSGYNIVVADCGCSAMIEEATALFSGGTILWMQVEDHDPIAAYVLGLSHAVNLAFSEALVRSGFSTEVLNAAASTMFRKQTAVSCEVSQENAPLYYAIQRENPYNDAAVNILPMPFLSCGLWTRMPSVPACRPVSRGTGRNKFLRDKILAEKYSSRILLSAGWAG